MTEDQAAAYKPDDELPPLPTNLDDWHATVRLYRNPRFLRDRADDIERLRNGHRPAPLVACDEQGCDPTVTGENCVGCPSLGVPVEITLTADQHAYVERLIAANTDTLAEPVTVEQYVQGIVDDVLAKHEQTQTGQSYG